MDFDVYRMDRDEEDDEDDDDDGGNYSHRSVVSGDRIDAEHEGDVWGDYFEEVRRRFPLLVHGNPT